MRLPCSLKTQHPAPEGKRSFCAPSGHGPPSHVRRQGCRPTHGGRAAVPRAAAGLLTGNQGSGLRARPPPLYGVAQLRQLHRRQSAALVPPKRCSFERAARRGSCSAWPAGARPSRCPQRPGTLPAGTISSRKGCPRPETKA